MVYSSLAVIFVEESFKQVVKMRFPIGIQSFEKLIKAGYLYVDKTELIYKMVDTGNYYFLSRPRSVWQIIVGFHYRGLFQREKGVV